MTEDKADQDKLQLDKAEVPRVYANFGHHGRTQSEAQS